MLVIFTRRLQNLHTDNFNELKRTVERRVRVKTQQVIIPDAKPINGLPLRHWRVEIWLLNEESNEVPATVFEKCVYQLHPTFENPVRKLFQAPFALEEQGWGEFEFVICCYFLEEGGEVEILHDLSFNTEAYAIDYTIQVPYHIPRLKQRLLESGTRPESLEDLPVYKLDINLEKWADMIIKLDEDTLTKVVYKILSHTSVKRQITRHPKDVPFVIDLYQLPGGLLDEIEKQILKEID